MRTDRRTDMTKLIVAFRNYENAPENTFNFWCEVELDKANRSLPVPAIRKPFWEMDGSMTKYGGKRGKRRETRKKKVRGGCESQNCKFRQSLETPEVSISHFWIGSELCDHEQFCLIAHYNGKLLRKNSLSLTGLWSSSFLHIWCLNRKKSLNIEKQ